MTQRKHNPLLLGTAFVSLFTSARSEEALKMPLPTLLLDQDMPEGRISFQGNSFKLDGKVAGNTIQTEWSKEKKDCYQVDFSIKNRSFSRYQTFGTLSMNKSSRRGHPQFSLSYVRMQDGFFISDVQINNRMFEEESYCLFKTNEDYIDVRNEENRTVFLHEHDLSLNIKAINSEEEDAVYLYKGSRSSYRESYQQAKGLKAIEKWIEKEDPFYYRVMRREQNAFQMDEVNFFENAVHLCMKSYPEQLKKTIFHIK